MVGFSRDGTEKNTQRFIIPLCNNMKHTHTMCSSDLPNSYKLSHLLFSHLPKPFPSLPSHHKVVTISCSEQCTPFKEQLTRLGFFRLAGGGEGKPRKYFRDLYNHEEDGENEQGSIFPPLPPT